MTGVKSVSTSCLEGLIHQEDTSWREQCSRSCLCQADCRMQVDDVPFERLPQGKDVDSVAICEEQSVAV